MGGRNHRGTNDARSSRKSRIPALVRRLLRAFPIGPDRRYRDGHINAPSIAELLGQLHLFTSHFAAIAARPPELKVSTEGYARLLDELSGAEGTATLRTGCYLIHEAGPWQRVLYIGSTSGSYIRARLISHLFPEQSLSGLARAMAAGLPELIDSALGQEERGDDAVDQALRRLLFGSNRWAAARGGARSQEEQYAIDLISSGAFDVTFIFVPEAQSVFARYIEEFLVKSAVELAGVMPPLNAVEVWHDRRHRDRAAQFGIPADYSAAWIRCAGNDRPQTSPR
jgi:hypothetical protein